MQDTASGVKYKTLTAANDPIHVALAAAPIAAGIGKSSLAKRQALPKSRAAGIKQNDTTFLNPRRSARARHCTAEVRNSCRTTR